MRCVAAVALAWGLLSLSHAYAERGPQPVGALEAQFVDGNWVLRVDRAWQGNGAAPQPDQLPESEYRPLLNGSTYLILVSHGGARVEIDGKKRTAVRPPMKGARSSPTEPLIYNLDEGTFAGGRLAVWQGKNGLQGELTIYGSGVYIISSERGAISRRH
jgi:hypothetical protein